MKINVIVTGASGMVGEGVLIECLNHPDVEKVLVIGRKPCGTTHPKLTEVLHNDFLNLAPIADKMKGYQACFFCLGVSSVGMKEPEYTKLTYTLATNFANTLIGQSPDLTFVYVSGASTDSTEKGKSMWARVKGKTENDLIKMPFKRVFAFRPGAMQPTPGMKNTLKLYAYVGWLISLIKLISPNSVLTLRQVGQAMINSATKGYDKKILEVPDIRALASR